MFIKLAILFITIPICEIFIFLEAGEFIGIWPTIMIVILTGIAGAYLARTQGFDLLQRIQSTLNKGELPTNELVDGVFILAGGLLLLTPGFITDLVGFLLLTPFSRNPLKKVTIDLVKRKIEKGEIIIGGM